MQTTTARERTAAAFAEIGMIVRIEDASIICPRTGIVETMPKNTAPDQEFADLARAMQARVTARLRFLNLARTQLAALAEKAAGRCADAVRLNVRVAPDTSRLTIVMVHGAGREMVLAETDRRLAFGEDGTVLPAVAQQLRREITARVRAAA